ncbi:MAG: hypothetical protein ACYTHJ_08990, partial [Planctomycetota bacterium]
MRIESNKAGIQPSALLVLPMLVAASTASAESITFTDQPSGPLVPFTQAGFDIEPFGTSSTDIIATGPTPPALAETTHYGSSSTRITMTEGGLFELAQRDYRAPGFPLDWVTVEGYVDGALVATQDAPDGSGTLANPLGLPVDEIRISLSTELAGDASVDNIELLPFTDCNANDINDITELEEGDSDCNNNGLLDECEPIITHDCCEVSQSAGCSDSAIAACVCGFDPFCCQTQWDQICVDNVDKFACGTCQAGVFDCNNNLLPDSCEVAEVDCNNNGVPDDCDTDSDNDGAPDACDVCPGGDDALDADSDGLADACDNCPGYSNGPNTTIFDQVSVQIDVGPAG